MSFKTLDVVSGIGGGAVRIAAAAKYPRSVFVTVLNLDIANAHVAFFGRSRRELVANPLGIPGGVALPINAAAVPAAGNGIQFAPGQGVATIAGQIAAFSTYVFAGWAGEIWAAADVTGKVLIEVLDAAAIEA